ncbi:MAG: hypothetical protein FWD57_07890, partial [Polyangiaceae bacterium]|nr:hypothetical protein [Polyangiaceae bacterium]
MLPIPIHKRSSTARDLVSIAVLSLTLVQCAGGDDSSLGSNGDGGRIGEADTGGETSFEELCSKDSIGCEGNMSWRCDSRGEKVDLYDCATEGKICVDAIGCVACEPGTASCSDNVGSYCPDDASGVVTFECDSRQGLSCETEGCVGPCSPQNLRRSHIGCDFWPTVTSNSAWTQWFQFGVLVVNTTNEPAEVTVTLGPDKVVSRSIEPKGVASIELPWIADLKGPDADASGIVNPPLASVFSKSASGGGSYRLRSDQPVVVTQFNTLAARNTTGSIADCPVDNKYGECLSYSNDASLLLPSSSLDTYHSIMGWRSWQLDPSPNGSHGIGDFISITAIENQTTVTVVPTSDVLPFDGDVDNGGNGGGGGGGGGDGGVGAFDGGVDSDYDAGGGAGGYGGADAGIEAGGDSGGSSGIEA